MGAEFSIGIDVQWVLGRGYRSGNRLKGKKIQVNIPTGEKWLIFEDFGNGAKGSKSWCKWVTDDSLGVGKRFEGSLVRIG